MKRSDIGFAGALGALAGLSVAIVYEWEILPTLLSAVVGIVVAVVAYRPLEIPTVVWSACQALPGALQSTPQFFRQWKKQIQKGCGIALVVIGCIVFGVLSFLAMPVLLYMCGVPSLLPMKEPDVGGYVFLTGALAFVGGCITFLYLVLVNEAKTPPWAWRMGKAFRWFKEKSRTESAEGTKGEALLICLLLPIFLQIMSIGLVVFFLDALSTLLLALASTERIAAILGAVLGWGTGVLLHSLGVPGDLILLALGTIVGWFAGPLLYRLREYLAVVPATATS